jgi:hypothetical protein
MEDGREWSVDNSLEGCSRGQFECRPQTAKLVSGSSLEQGMSCPEI